MTRRPTAAPTDRARVRRTPEKAAYDRATVDAILDACPVAHVGYVLDGAPLVTPTLQWREGDHVYWHGSAASRMLSRVDGAPVCLTVTLTDGLLLARSGFEHSINYRSVMLMGTAHLVAEPEAKTRHLQAMMDQMFPGRWPLLRPMTETELKATTLLSLRIDEASAKISAGMPDDPPQDRAWPVWAGIIPVTQVLGVPQPDPESPPGLPLPDVRFGRA
jgi:nitroimidazol reductase NimA-like FMN-containing flavoprotein (pyridoxamine 5'-phosphate oxidase superfamily)